MSPGIGHSSRVSPFVSQVRGKPTRHQVLAAMALARSCGISLRQGTDSGVILDERTGKWGADPRHSCAGINVIGAVLLAFQPEASADEDPGAVAGRSLGVQLAYSEGLLDGWNHETHSSFWLGADLNRKHYLAGHVAGVESFAFNTLVCDRCGSRRFRAERVCPGCDGRYFGPRPAGRR